MIYCICRVDVYSPVQPRKGKGNSELSHYALTASSLAFFSAPIFLANQTTKPPPFSQYILEFSLFLVSLPTFPFDQTLAESETSLSSIKPSLIHPNSRRLGLN